ncbi:hypothetical protein AAVH_24085 [Aphelenchoides avenae]|nr:hypothetical protein AAVH_24085 [Aphelenchus avenae]
MEVASNRFNRVVDDLKQSSVKYVGERAQALKVAASGIGVELLRKADGSGELFTKLVGDIGRRRADSYKVQSKFTDAFKRLTSLETTEVNRASVAGLTDSQCRQALLLACKMLENVGKLELVEIFLSAALNQVYEHTVEQFAKLETVARALANELVALLKKEGDALRKRTSNVKIDQQQRNDEFIALAEKAARDTNPLINELERVKASAWKADGEAMELRRWLAQADEDISSLQASNGELSEKVTSLEEQLEKWIARGECAVKFESRYCKTYNKDDSPL